MSDEPRTSLRHDLDPARPLQAIEVDLAGDTITIHLIAPAPVEPPAPPEEETPPAPIVPPEPTPEPAPEPAQPPIIVQPVADVQIDIGAASDVTSRLLIGVKHIDNDTLMYGNPSAEASARQVVKDSFSLQASHMNAGFGFGDAWPWDGSGSPPPAPSQWQTHDLAMASISDIGLPTVLSVFQPAAWMRANRAGPMTTAQTFVYDARLQTSKKGYYQTLIRAFFERYGHLITAAQSHNEEKGYLWSRAGLPQHHDIDTHPGTPGDVGDHGFIDLYKVIAEALPAGLPFGGPYTVLACQGRRTANSVPAGHPLYGRVWGTINKMALAGLWHFAAEVTRLGLRWDTCVIDFSTRNKDDVFLTDDWTNLARVTEIITFIRSELDRRGYAHVKLRAAEIYLKPQQDPGNGAVDYRLAIKGEGIMRAARAGLDELFFWGLRGEGDEPGRVSDGAIVTSTSAAGGGQPTKIAQMLASYKTHFPAGTPLHPVASSSDEIAGLAGPTWAWLINRSAHARTVALNGNLHTLTPHQSLFVPHGPGAA